MQKSIKVNLIQHPYKIFIGNNSLDLFVDQVNKEAVSQCLVIVDSNVIKYHNVLLRKIFSFVRCKTHYYNFIANEKNKSLKSVEKIYNFLSKNSFDRNSAIIAIGGGIVGDIAGFATSTFMRGIKFYQLPTTLLSMVDSSVGGKTGVNFSNRKNLIGTFYQPEAVFIYSDFLKSLPKREIISGAGEVFKYAFLADKKNYSLIKTNLEKLFESNSTDYEKVISNCIKIKADVVENDVREITGLRKILNLGHTFAHAFESESDYKLKHGEAVIAGIFCALSISEKAGYLNQKLLDIFLQDFSFLTVNKIVKNLNTENIYFKMIGDKKNSNSKIKLVLLEDIGNVVVDVVLEKSIIIESIEWVKENI